MLNLAMFPDHSLICDPAPPAPRSPQLRTEHAKFTDQREAHGREAGVTSSHWQVRDPVYLPPAQAFDSIT